MYYTRATCGLTPLREGPRLDGPLQSLVEIAPCKLVSVRMLYGFTTENTGMCHETDWFPFYQW